LAPPEKKKELLVEFLEYASATRSAVAFFNIGPRDLALFRRYSFEATKWGEEALIDLTTCDWSGGNYEWVRRQSNYCRRQGLAIRECRPEEMSAHDRQELAEISRLFLANKPQ